MSPTKPGGVASGASTLSSQASYRYLATLRDQHALNTCRWATDGRPWWGYREMAANRGDIDGFCTTPQPGDHEAEIPEQWNAPWMPDTTFFEFDYRRLRIRIRYDRMISHYDQAASVYYRRVNMACAKQGWEPYERGDLPRDAITDVFGDPPLNSRIFKAAQASHPWILGFSQEPDEELAKMLGLSIPGAGIYNTPRKEGLISADKMIHLTEAELDAKIARAIEVAQHIQSMKSAEHGKKVQAGRERSAESKRAALAARLQKEEQGV